MIIGNILLCISYKTCFTCVDFLLYFPHRFQIKVDMQLLELARFYSTVDIVDVKNIFRDSSQFNGSFKYMATYIS